VSRGGGRIRIEEDLRLGLWAGRSGPAALEKRGEDIGEGLLVEGGNYQKGHR